MAVSYRMLNKPDEVVRNETEALAIWRQIGQKRGLAFSLNEMAKAKATLGKNKEAIADFQEALQIRREIGDKRGLGDTLIEMGNFADDAGDHDRLSSWGRKRSRWSVRSGMRACRRSA